MNNNAFHSSLEMHQIKHQWDSTLCLLTHPCPAIVMLERVFLPYLVYLWICSILSFEFSCFTRPFCLIVSSLSSASLHCSAWGPLVVLHSAWVFSSLSPLASHLKLISPPFWAFFFLPVFEWERWDYWLLKLLPGTSGSLHRELLGCVFWRTVGNNSK